MSPRGRVEGEDGDKRLRVSHAKWNENAISWPDNPYSADNLKQRMPPAQRPVVFATCGDVMGESGTAADVDRTPNGVPVAGPAVVSLTSKCADLSLYKRDYFVPSARDETLNGLDEKVSLRVALGAHRYKE